ncbi:MAG: hypothetical protein K2X27_19190 [Candidatus Obscuribacterales bacterium]|nr:hypothetical protein [Candidatus Obscuribacterales bacterium]
MPLLFTRLASLTIGLTLLCSFALPAAFCDVLKGNVSKEGEKENTGLSRSDIGNQADDPFSSDEEKSEISAPSDMYKMDTPRKPNPPLRGNVGDQGQRAMQPQQPRFNPFDGEGEPMPNLPPPAAPMQQQTRGQDPDSSPEMQLAWDMWHKRVAEAIYTRFNFLAKLGFRHSPPLLCQVAYVVTRDGHIQNIQVQQKSTNVLFNVIVFQTVKSLDGDINLLQYPPGSRRQFVPKVGTFTQNYGGDGFKYTVGDKETLQGR